MASQSAILSGSELIKMLTSSISPLYSLVKEHIGQLKVVSSAYKIKFWLSLYVYRSYILWTEVGLEKSLVAHLFQFL